ncbi:MAG: dipeptide epimerase [Acetomicrobium flavidum]|uniref:dipeptide epimerase n=1 Tax=Acetomicrobium flavidum TaxID=49896 RepID=UPI0016AD7C68|nr:dipeptide epimerase [Acetomicrobium flavidum]
MKISSIKVSEIEIPLNKPFRISLGIISKARIAMVEIQTDEGISGFGEGASALLITGDVLGGIKEGIKILGNAIIGMDPIDIEKVYWAMNKTLMRNPAAKAAIDIAVHDLIGKITNQPLYKLLGGYRDTFITDLTIGIDDPEEMAISAKKAVDQGFGTIKIKVGISLKEDVERIQKIREAVGKDVRIRVDANQGWNAKEAINIIGKIAEYDIELVEQPVPACDLEGLAHVTKNTPVPIMADESVFNASDVLNIIKMRAADIINIKLMKCGGLKEAQKINTLAEVAGMECMLGCMAEESNIGITAAASLGAACKNITRGDLDATFFLSSLPIKGGAVIEGGKINLPNVPGLGLMI